MRVYLVLGAVAILCLFVVALSVGPQDSHRFIANGWVAKQDLATIAQAAEQFALDHGGRYPSSIQDLLVGGARKEGYLADRVTAPKDPWKREYRVAFRVGTLGRDGKPGGTGEDQDLWIDFCATR
jgi:hypothetical protein